MFDAIVIIIILTLLPFLELRASIPYGIFNTSIHWTMVFLICVITNIVLGPIVYVILDKFIHLFLKIRLFDKWYQRNIEKTQKKIRPAVEKYGVFGLGAFIGIPLPGSGSYSGALIAYILGFRLKRFIIANIIGVLMAGAIVTAICVSGSGIFRTFLRL